MQTTAKKGLDARADCYEVLGTPVGTLYLSFQGSVLVGIDFRKPVDIPRKKGAFSASATAELTEYFENRRREFTCRTKFTGGTEFERLVWNVLTDVPYGETRSYKWLAEKIGRPAACRAVGRALGKNPLPIIFPCHRIIEHDGSLGGFSPGTDLKQKLLDFEYYTSIAERTETG